MSCLCIEVLEVFEAFQQTAQPMRSFYVTTCKTDCLQILYKFLQKLNFRTEYSASADTIVAL